MAEVKHRCRLYLQVPAQPSAKLEAQLAQAIGSTGAACVLLCGDAQGIDKIYAERLIQAVQAQGLACLLEDDIALAKTLGADGVHLPAAPEIYADARKRLGASANIGGACGLSRHDAMVLAELGADYVAFGPVGGSKIDGIDQCADLIAWWSDIFVVPCVAWNVDNVADAARLAVSGADFIALDKAIWCDDNPQQIIGEIDSALREARRAA
jgi:thiamine-phosphate pyrophosphorylase